MTVRLHRAARLELGIAIDWYDEREPGLGEEFLLEVERSIEIIDRNPEAWPRWPSEPRARRFVMRRFPYVIAYLHRDEQITLVAVAHMRRRPGTWRTRLAEK